MNRDEKFGKAAKRFLIFIVMFVGIFVFSQQNLFCEETGIDLYCFENAPYVVIGDISDIKDSVEAKDYSYWKAKVAQVKVQDVLVGPPMPEHISILFDLDKQHTKDKRLSKGSKVLLFLNPSLAYYYTPIIYGSVYYIKDADVKLWKEKIGQISLLLRGAIPEDSLRAYGFYNLNECKIFYKTAGGLTEYNGEFTLSGNGIAKVEIRQVGRKEPLCVELKVPPEYIKDLITTFVRMDFFNTRYVENKQVMDAPWETITYTYGKKSNTIEGYAGAYPTKLEDYYFSRISSQLCRLLTYIMEKNDVVPGMAYDSERDLLPDRSLESLKKIIDSGRMNEVYQDIINSKEKDILVPYLISKIDFKDNTDWFQAEARVNIIRLLRYLTKKDLGYDDEFLYNSTDEEIQKVKASWENLWGNK
ncbi:MAG: hypothetical protein WCY36_08310 [Candidatus Omnitrophota bacterium]